MSKQKIIYEKELFEPIYKYFFELGYEVHGEVKDCDITLLRDDELIIIELKTSLNLALLIQASKRQRISEKVYVAIPRPSYSVFSGKWKDICYILKRLELGLITVNTNGMKKVDVVFDPGSFSRQKSLQQGKRRKKLILNEINGRHGNYNTGGTTKTKIMTAYKESSIHIACCLRMFGELSPAKLKKIGTSTKTQSILYKNYYGWFEKVGHGIYDLTDDGLKVLEQYPEHVKYYNGIIKENAFN
jgi:hypothetical protein